MALDSHRLTQPPKKLLQLVKKTDRDADAKQVHGLRTNIRRLEVIFHALSLENQGVDRSLIKELGQLRKLSGPVRDMDVLTRYAASMQVTGEEDCQVRLLEYLGAHRRKCAKRLYRKLRKLRPSLRKDLKALPAALDSITTEDGASSRDVTGGALAATAVRIATELAAPQPLTRRTLHPYRLKVKELQNALRLARDASNSGLIGALGEVKTVIGEWHDWEDLVSILDRALDHPNGCDLRREAKSIAADKYREARSRAEALREDSFRKNAASTPKRLRQSVWAAAAKLAK